MIGEALFSSASQTWRTPPPLFDALHKEFRFTVDAAADAANAALPRFWTRYDSGLVASWSGERVWCNPPYGRHVGMWTAKAAECLAELAVMLLPARVDTSWWHRDVMGRAIEVRLIEGRVRFDGAPAGAPFPSVLVIWGPEWARGPGAPRFQSWTWPGRRACKEEARDA